MCQLAGNCLKSQRAIVCRRTDEDAQWQGCRVAQASINAWPSGVSVADFRSDIIKCRLSGSCLPLLSPRSTWHFWLWLLLGSGAEALLQSVIDTTVSQVDTLECGGVVVAAAQVWRRVMFVCRQTPRRVPLPSPQFAYLDWPIRFLTHSVGSLSISCCCSLCPCQNDIVSHYKEIALECVQSPVQADAAHAALVGVGAWTTDALTNMPEKRIRHEL